MVSSADVAHQLGMPASDVRDHRSVAGFVSLGNAMRLPVKLVTNGKLAESVPEQITVKSFDFLDLIADIHGLRRFAHWS